MCDLIYREGILRTKPGEINSAVDAILEDEELSAEFSGQDFYSIMMDVGFYAIDRKEKGLELRYHAYPEDTFFALEKLLKKIAEYIVSGCYLEFSDKKGNLCRYVFDGKIMRRVEPTIIWPYGTINADTIAI